MANKKELISYCLFGNYTKLNKNQIFLNGAANLNYIFFFYVNMQMFGNKYFRLFGFFNGALLICAECVWFYV